MSQPKYKLVYFNAKAAAEVTRCLFKYGNIEFEDIRIEREHEWPKLKPSTPFGVLPYLEFEDGQIISESIAIARYVAKLVGLAGNNDIENLEIDSIVDSYRDFRLAVYRFYKEEDPKRKQELLEKVENESIPFYLSRFEEIIKKNNGHMALNRLTWADILLATQLPLLDRILGSKNFIAKYPNCAAMIKNVENIPQIKKWIETRPVTER